MMKLDLSAIRRKWLHLCGSCDAGLPMSCTCTQDDPRQQILVLVNHLEDLYGNFDILLCSTLGGAVERLEHLEAQEREVQMLRSVLRAVKGRLVEDLDTSQAAHDAYLLITPRMLGVTGDTQN